MSDIPGFYYDVEKKKYFKIGAGFQPPKKEPVTLAKFSPIIDQTVNVTKMIKSAAIGQISTKRYKLDISKFLYQNDRFHTELPIGLHERLFIARVDYVLFWTTLFMFRAIFLIEILKILNYHIVTINYTN